MAEGHEKVKRLCAIIKILPFRVYKKLDIGIFIINTVCLICNNTANVVEFLLARLIIDFFGTVWKKLFFTVDSFSMNWKKFKKEKIYI